MLLLVWEYLLNGYNVIHLSYLLLVTDEKMEAFHNVILLQQKGHVWKEIVWVFFDILYFSQGKKDALMCF